MAAVIIAETARIIGLVGDVFLNPALTAPALAFLTCGGPDRVASLLPPTLLNALVRAQSARISLGVLVAVGLAKVWSRRQSSRALNHWRTGPNPGWNWTQEIAVVTGGCNGIGKATVLGLVRRGVRVAILDVADLPEDLASVPSILYQKCDISDPAAVHEAAEAIRWHFGHPSILVNNAGMVGRGAVLDVPPETVTRVFGVNLFAHYYTVQEFLPHMIQENKGHIVTVSSVAAFVTMAGSTTYAASKAGILSFHEGLTSEIRNVFKAPGVMTTMVQPSWVKTDMMRDEKGKHIKPDNEMLQPETVAMQIVHQLVSCRGGHLICPSHVSFVSGLRGFPSWVGETIRDIVAQNFQRSS